MNHSMSVIFPFCSHSPLILSMYLMICLHCQSRGWISHDLPQDILNSSRWFPMKYSLQSPFSLGKSHEITMKSPFSLGFIPWNRPFFPVDFTHILTARSLPSRSPGQRLFQRSMVAFSSTGHSCDAVRWLGSMVIFQHVFSRENEEFYWKNHKWTMLTRETSKRQKTVT